MQGIRMEMDWQRVYRVTVWRDTENGGAKSEDVSVLVFVDHESDDSQVHPENGYLVMEIVELLSNAGEEVLEVRHAGSQDVY
jgi:putative heme iron utilization protein